MKTKGEKWKREKNENKGRKIKTKGETWKQREKDENKRRRMKTNEKD